MASDPRAKLGYTAGANPAGRTATLVGDGPLAVDTAHWLAVVLPRYHPTVGHGKHSSQRLCEDVFGPSLILSADVASWHMNWHLLPSFMTNYLLKLLAVKLKWDIIDDVPTARRHVYEVALLLPDADRTVLPVHVYRTARNAVATGTYYDLLTAAKLAGGAPAPIVFFFRSLYAGGFTPTELQDANSDFRQQVAHVLTCSKSQSAALVGQAADICIFIRRVFPKGMLWPFVPIEEMFSEASRLMEPEDERFKTEFDIGHADVFEVFSRLLPASAPEVMLAYIANMLPSGTKATYSSVKGLNDALIGEDIVSLLNMNSNFKTASAAVRSREALKILNAADGEDDDSKSSKQVRDALKSSADFRSLITAVADHRAQDKDAPTIFIMMASHICPVGASWLAGAKVLHSTLQQNQAVRSVDVADKVTDATLAVDVDGRAQSWQIAIPGQNALLKLLKGAKVDIFQTFALPVIRKQRGAMVASELQHLTDATVWTNDRAMRYAEQAFTAVKALMGCTGTHADSYRSYYRGMHRRCEKLDGLPEWVEEKPNLRRNLNQIGVQAEHEFLAHVREIATQPLEYAKRSPTYIQQGKQCAELVNKFDTVMATVLTRSELAADFGNNGGNGDGSAGSAVLASSHTASLLSYSTAPGGAARDGHVERHVGSKFKQLSLGREERPAAPPTNLVAEFGLYLSPFGLVFGNQFLVGPTASATWVPKDEAQKIQSKKRCASVWAPNASAANRGRYCTKDCKHATAYDRVVSDDDITVISLQRDNEGWQQLADPSEWVHVIGANKLDEFATAFSKLVARRAESTDAGAQKGRGNPGRGYQGREENRRYGRGAKGRGAGKGSGKPTGKPNGKGTANAKGGGRANGAAISRLHFETAAPAPPRPTLKTALKPTAKAAAPAESADKLLASLLGPKEAAALQRTRPHPRSETPRLE